MVLARKFVPMSVFVGDAVIVENETEAASVLVIFRSPWIPVGVAHWRTWCYCFISIAIPFPLAAEFRIFARRPEDPIVEFCCRVFTRVRTDGN
jgi:hypothetical protein